MFERLTPEIEGKVIYLNKKDMFPKFFKDLCDDTDEVYQIATKFMYELVKTGRIKNNIPVIRKKNEG